MRCSTCGEYLDGTTPQCPTCGAAVTRQIAPAMPVHRCPRCGYRGDGIRYFRRPAHFGLLVGLGLFTYGLGALVYWLIKRKHWVCPNCGLGWEHSARALPGQQGAASVAPPLSASSSQEVTNLPSSGIGRRVTGVVTILIAMIVIVAGIFAPELAAVGVGSVIAGGGMLSYWWGNSALQERRRVLMTGLQRQVLMLAQEKGGSLTVTEVAASLNLSLPAAEKLLISMDDGFRVRSDVTEQGIVLYEFPEVQHRRLLDSGSSS